MPISIATTAAAAASRCWPSRDVPLYQDLNQPSVRSDLNIEVPFDQVHIYACRVRAGDDVSCLNLYQPLRPRLLACLDGIHSARRLRVQCRSMANAEGKSQSLAASGETNGRRQRPGFRRCHDRRVCVARRTWATSSKCPTNRAKRWRSRSSASCRKASFKASWCWRRQFPQALSASRGLQLFPHRRSQRHDEKTYNQPWRRRWRGRASFVSSTAQRVESYLAVENTYLATFQALGGLGLLLGAGGLAIVLLRGVWERRSELALLAGAGLSRRLTHLAGLGRERLSAFGRSGHRHSGGTGWPWRRTGPAPAPGFYGCGCSDCWAR